MAEATPATASTVAPPSEVLADETPGTSPVAPKEKDKPKEISGERKKAEIRRITNNILYRKMQDVKDKEAAGTALTEGEKKIRVLAAIDSLSEGKVILFSGDPPLRFTLTEKTTSGVEYPVTAVLEGADFASASELRCHFRDDQGNPLPDRMMTRKEIANRHLVVEKTTLLSAFEGIEQDAVRQYVALEENPGALAENADDLIKRAASEEGMLTFDDLSDYVKSVEAQGTGLTDPKLQAENARLVGISNEIRTKVGGNLLDQDTIRDIFVANGYTTEKFQGLLEEAQGAVKTFEERLKLDPKNQKLKDQLTQARVQVRVFEQGMTAFNDGGIVDGFFTKMDRGEIPLDQAKKIADMFRKGQFDEMVEEMADKSLPEEERKKLKEQLIDLGKKGGLISLFLVILLGTGAENFKGIVSLDQR